MANWITLVRFPLLMLALALLASGSAPFRLIGVAVMLAGLLLDTVDGIVARRRGETSLLGSVLDIAADRTYELAIWIFFAGEGLIPVAFPIAVAARTALTDALRSIGVAQGTPPLAQHRTRLGRFLVQSAWMRIGYQTSKIVAFIGMGIALSTGGRAWTGAVPIISTIALVFCLLRGLPVLTHAAREHLSGGWARA